MSNSLGTPAPSILEDYSDEEKDNTITALALTLRALEVRAGEDPDDLFRLVTTMRNMPTMRLIAEDILDSPEVAGFVDAMWADHRAQESEASARELLSALGVTGDEAEDIIQEAYSLLASFSQGEWESTPEPGIQMTRLSNADFEGLLNGSLSLDDLLG